MRTKEEPEGLPKKRIMDVEIGTMMVFRPFNFYPERYVEIASQQYQEGIRSKLDPSKAWIASGVDWVAAARVSDNRLCVFFVSFLHAGVKVLYISAPLPLLVTSCKC